MDLNFMTNLWRQMKYFLSSVCVFRTLWQFVLTVVSGSQTACWKQWASVSMLTVSAALPVAAHWRALHSSLMIITTPTVSLITTGELCTHNDGARRVKFLSRFNKVFSTTNRRYEIYWMKQWCICLFVAFLLLLDCRRFSPLCVSCNEPIIPDPGSEETLRVVALEKNFHLKCYRCEVWNIKMHQKLSLTPRTL